MKNALFCVAAVLLSCWNTAADHDQKPIENGDPVATAIADLAPALNKKEIAIRFTVDELHGIAGRFEPGQASPFVITTKIEHETRRLEVWVKGELAEVFDRFQMSCYQPDQLKKGTVIVATGVLRLHKDARDGESYTLYVDEWQKFRITHPVRTKQA